MHALWCLSLQPPWQGQRLRGPHTFLSALLQQQRKQRVLHIDSLHSHRCYTIAAAAAVAAKMSQKPATAPTCESHTTSLGSTGTASSSSRAEALPRSPIKMSTSLMLKKEEIEAAQKATEHWLRGALAAAAAL